MRLAKGMPLNTDCTHIAPLEGARAKVIDALTKEGFDLSSKEGLRRTDAAMAYAMNTIRCEQRPAVEVHKQAVFTTVKVAVVLMLVARGITMAAQHAYAPPDEQMDDKKAKEGKWRTALKDEDRILGALDAFLTVFVGLVVWYKFDITGGILGSGDWEPSINVSGMDKLFVTVAGAVCVYTGLKATVPFPVPLATVAVISGATGIYHLTHRWWPQAPSIVKHST